MPDEDDDLGRAPTASSDAPDAEPALVRTSTGFRVVEVGATLGRYQLVEELGEGGMATVYRARDQELRRDVAVKVLFPHLAKRVDIVRRFDREARAAAGLEHPNILRVYDVGGGSAPGGDPPYIVMELVRGASLKDAIDARGPMLAELCACAGALLADALAAAHTAGVIHRDVKPANVMVATGGRLLLADFGVARVEDDDSLVTRTGALLGTPAFMSPEQATGGDVDARSDVYSLGATLYQLATGVLPHSGSAARVVAAIASGELVPPVRRRPAIGVELSRQIERMMATEPQRRPATAAAAADELRRMVTDAGLGDPADELAAYFADPPAYTAAKVPVVVGRLADRARAARAGGKLPRAMALIDRASALAPDDPAIQTLVGELAKRRPTRWLVLAGLGTIALGVGAVVVYRTARTAALSPDAALDAGALAMTVDAAPAAVDSADAALAITPAPADAATGTTVIATGADARQPRADARTAIGISRADAAAIAVAAPPDATPAPAPAPPDAAPPAAQKTAITVTMDSWCTLSIDGTGHGRADARPRTIEVTPGDHDVACTKEGVGATWKKRVHVDAGKTVAVRGQLLTEVTVTIGTKNAVKIDGARHASGVRVPLTPGRHRVELGGKAFYIDVPRGSGCTLRDTDDPDRPADCFQ
jgi:eukaryotic-like serine/threonine-protein kinase